MTLRIFGIKSCDTMKKARSWLTAEAHSVYFHDYRVEGIDRATLLGWVEALGWETILNRAGTTFRSLPDAEKVDLDADRAVALMLAQPTMIKRPILVGPGVLLAGFKPDIWAERLSGSADQGLAGPS